NPAHSREGRNPVRHGCARGLAKTGTPHRRGRAERKDVTERSIRSGREKAARNNIGRTSMTKSGSDISRRAFVGGAAALAAAGLPSGTALAQSESPAPKRGGILKVSAYLNPTKLDPVACNGGQDQTFLCTVFDTITDFDPATMKPRPGLASSSSPDPRTMALQLIP